MENYEMVYDIFKELFNISVGKAADMLSQILHKKIWLNVPNLEILKLDNGSLPDHVYFHDILQGTLMVSSISFQEDLQGDAHLVFPADKMRVIINLCLEQEINVDPSLDFNDLDFDVTKEIGNIILNSIMGEMGNFLAKKLCYSLPQVKVFDRADLEDRIKEKKYAYSLLLSISFLIGEVEVSGAVIINLTIDSLEEIMRIAKTMEDDLYG